MPRTIHFLRHAETKIDQKIPVSEWRLTKSGIDASRNLASSGIFDSVNAVFSSDEPKALLTATPFAERIGAVITAVPEFRELDRGSRFTTDDGYQESVRITLNEPDKSVEGWERNSDALWRFEQGLSRIRSHYGFNEALIVSHGLILSIYFGHLLKVKETYSRWKQLRFCAWGTVQDDHLVKDIVSE